MKQYQGAVFFVDMLGVGALTRSQVPLTDVDYEGWQLSHSKRGPSANYFCAKLLLTFRNCLNEIHNSDDSLNVAQLSDSAFIWSRDVAKVAEAARRLMWRVTRRGLLCRGGLAFGEIVEPDKVNRDLGQFIVGEAVTRAVSLEGLGKGCRVFTDQRTACELLALRSRPFDNAICDITNPLDGTVVDEFRWYATGGLAADWSSSPHVAMRSILSILSLLLYSPRFNWNTANKEGLVHLARSVDFISHATREFVGHEDYVRRGDIQLENADLPRVRDDRWQKRVLARWLADTDMQLKRRA